MHLINHGRRLLSPSLPTRKLLHRELNANRAVVTGVRRPQPVRTYPTLLVNPDGSTYEIRYSVPRRIIKLPINIELCSEEDRLRIQKLRLKREKVTVTKDFDSSFDPSQYL